MNTATETRKWTSTAGPRQVKQVKSAFGDLRMEHATYIQLAGVKGVDERQMVLVSLFSGETREDVTKAQEELAERYGYEITRENCKAIVADVAAALVTLKANRPIKDERTTPEARAESVRLMNERHEEHKKEREEQDKALEIEAAKYPYLSRDKSKSSWALGAANIRTELAKAFPGIKFSVTSESFSMGCSIDIRWQNGPTSDEVNAITKKYEYGRFDAMQDLATIDHAAFDWSRIFGGAKYVMASRSMADGLQEQICLLLCEAQGVGWTGLTSQRELCGASDCYDLGSHAHQTFSASSMPAGAVVNGVESPDNIMGWRLTFEPLPEPPKAPERKTRTETTNTETSATISEHTHTKRGFQMWIVELAEKVSRERYSELLTEAKNRGGWYSRKWGTTPAGFAFKEEEQAQDFAAIV